MYVADQDTEGTTLFAFVGKVEAQHSDYQSVQILFADSFDYAALPKFVRARKMMTIDCTPREGNRKNEAGLKRLARIMAALEGCKTKDLMTYGNSITRAEFMNRAA